MTTIEKLAAEYEMQPYELRAFANGELHELHDDEELDPTLAAALAWGLEVSAEEGL